MTEYTVHFQKGTRVGTRSFRMVYVDADDPREAEALAKADFREPGYRVTKITFFEWAEDDDGPYERLTEA